MRIHILISTYRIKHAILQLEFWIYPGTFYGICAPHKLPSNQKTI